METEPLLCDRFRVGKLLGRGGMGAVYEAYDSGLRRDVAIKRVLAIEVSVEDRERMTREARTIAALSSPHIVQVFDLVGDERELCIVMERLHGAPLSNLLNDARLSDAEFLGLIVQALVGLSDAHAAGVIHRDIKPENIFVVDRSPPLVKVLDFGIAKSMDHGTTSNASVVGTPAYMSPEQVKCLPLTPRVDVFAIGVILYRHFAGRFPFGERAGPGYLADVCAGNYDPIETVRPDLPPALVHLINGALAQDPRKRTASADSLRLEIIAYLAGAEADTSPPLSRTLNETRSRATLEGATTTASPPVTPKRRSHAFVAVALALAVVSVAALVTIGAARPTTSAHAGTSAVAPTRPDESDPVLPVVIRPPAPRPLPPETSPTAPLPSSSTTGDMRPGANAARKPSLPIAPPRASADDSPPRL